MGYNWPSCFICLILLFNTRISLDIYAVVFVAWYKGSCFLKKFSYVINKIVANHRFCDANILAQSG